MFNARAKNFILHAHTTQLHTDIHTQHTHSTHTLNTHATFFHTTPHTHTHTHTHIHTRTQCIHTTTSTAQHYMQSLFQSIIFIIDLGSGNCLKFYNHGNECYSTVISAERSIRGNAPKSIWRRAAEGEAATFNVRTLAMRHLNCTSRFRYVFPVRRWTLTKTHCTGTYRVPSLDGGPLQKHTVQRHVPGPRVDAVIRVPPQVSSIIEHFKCVICMGRIRAATVTHCGHRYCESCIAEWINLK